MDQLSDAWFYIGVLIHGVLSFAASAHAVLCKRDSRAAVGWVGMICLVPLAGAVLYTVFGVNRTRRRAYRLRSDPVEVARPSQGAAVASETLTRSLEQHSPNLISLAQLVHRLTGRPLPAGNRSRAARWCD